jgi:hypothetical protein
LRVAAPAVLLLLLDRAAVLLLLVARAPFFDAAGAFRLLALLRRCVVAIGT